MTVVDRSRLAGAPPTWGAKPNSANAATLPASVTPFSDPAYTAQYTDLGSVFLARRSASATDSNHALPTAASYLMVAPASTDSTAPVMYRDSSDARNSTALLMSAGSTQGIGSTFDAVAA